MFKLKRSKHQLAEQTELFNEATFYKQFRRDINKATTSLVIESPFMTVKRTNSLIVELDKAVRRGVEVKVYTREPAHHPASLEVQALESVELLKSVGVRVFACSDMRHRKLAVIDEQIVREGSLNILSQANSRELMRRTLSKQQVQLVRTLTT